MDNYRNGGVGYQNQGTNTSQNPNGGKNRNRKKKNKQNQPNHQINQNIPLSPSKNVINHYADYGGSMSLDHQSFARPYNNKYSNNQNFNYNNQNNRSNFNNSPTNNNNGKFIKRRNGSQSNYYNGNYENDRLNKSLTPNNSFGENSKIQTSISLDNFDMVNNQKRSPITNTYSFLSSNVIINQKTSPYKNSAYSQQQTIIEHVNLEEELLSEATNSLSIQEVEAKSNDIFPSITSTESLNTSGDFMVDDTPLSCYSTPLNHQSDSSRLVDADASPRKHRENEDSLNQNDKTPVKYDESEQTVKHEIKSDDSSAVSSDSSPDSKNSDQNLVTASEGESSFNNENTVMHHHEHNLARELEQIAHNFELPVDRCDGDSNKSVNGSVGSSSTESFSTTSNEIEKYEEKQDQIEEQNEEIVPEKTQIEQNGVEETQLREDEIVPEKTQIEQNGVEENKLREDEIVPEKTQIEQNGVEETQEQKVMEEIKEQINEPNEEKKIEDKLEVVPVEEIPVIGHVEPEMVAEETKTKAENIETKPTENADIIFPAAYEIRIRPQVEEIDLADEEPLVIKQDDILNIVPVDTEKSEENLEEFKEEVEVLNQTVESIVDLSKVNTSLSQKEPVVDCFSCTIV